MLVDLILQVREVMNRLAQRSTWNKSFELSSNPRLA